MYITGESVIVNHQRYGEVRGVVQYLHTDYTRHTKDGGGNYQIYSVVLDCGKRLPFVRSYNIRRNSHDPKRS